MKMQGQGINGKKEILCDRRSPPVKGQKQNPPFKVNDELLRLSRLGFAHKGKRHILMYDIRDLNLMRGAAGSDQVKVSDAY